MLTSSPPLDVPLPPPPAPPGARARRERWVTAGVLALVGLGLVLRFDAAWGLVLVGVVLVPLERVFRRHDQPVLRPGWRTDVLHFLCTRFLEIGCLLAAAGITWLVLHPFTIQPASAWIAGLPFAGQALLAFVLFELTYYAEHRLAHEWGFLWRFHALHHSSERLDWLAAARLHPVEAFFGGFVIVPVFVLLGFTPVTVAAVQAVQTAWALLLHANVRWRLRFLDRIWPSPEYHHWHHSNEPEARNSNYGLPLLDTIFGTYHLPADRRPQVYGIDAPTPAGYVAQLRDPLRRRRPAPAPDPAPSAPASPAAGPAAGPHVGHPVGHPVGP